MPYFQNTSSFNHILLLSWPFQLELELGTQLQLQLQLGLGLGMVFDLMIALIHYWIELMKRLHKTTSTAYKLQERL